MNRLICPHCNAKVIGSGKPDTAMRCGKCKQVFTTPPLLVAAHAKPKKEKTIREPPTVAEQVTAAGCLLFVVAAVLGYRFLSPPQKDESAGPSNKTYTTIQAVAEEYLSNDRNSLMAANQKYKDKVISLRHFRSGNEFASGGTFLDISDLHPEFRKNNEPGIYQGFSNEEAVKVYLSDKPFIFAFGLEGVFIWCYFPKSAIPELTKNKMLDLSNAIIHGKCRGVMCNKNPVAGKIVIFDDCVISRD